MARCIRKWPIIMSAVLAAVSLFVSYRFVYSNIGRAAIAVRENRFVAQSIGVSPFHLGLLTFVLAAGIAACRRLVRQLRLVRRSRSFRLLLHDFHDHHGTCRRQGNAGRPGLWRNHRGGAGGDLRDFKELRFSIFGLIVMAVVFSCRAASWASSAGGTKSALGSCPPCLRLATFRSGLAACRPYRILASE